MNTTNPGMAEADEFLGKTWLERMEFVAAAIAGEVPVVGPFIDVLIALFWPGGESIWDMIKDQVSQLIDEKIFQAELNEREEDLKAIGEEINYFKIAKGPTEKGNYLTNLIIATNSLRDHLIGSLNSIQLIPLVVATAQLEMGLQHERAVNGLTYYPKGDPQVWLNDLKSKLEIYKGFFKDAYPKWTSWRESLIKVEYGQVPVAMAAQMRVTDSLTGFNIYYQTNTTSNYDMYQALANATGAMLKSYAKSQIASVLSSTFYLDRFVPGQEKAAAQVNPMIAQFVVGPIGIATLGVSDANAYWTSIIDEPGVIDKILVRAWNSIDGLQMFYKGRNGNFVGDPTGGQAFEIAPPAGQHFTGLRMGFATGVMYEVQVVMSGSESPTYGNKGGWSGAHFDGSVGPGYQLIGAQYEKGSGPSNTIGIQCIQLKFIHRSLAGDI